MDIKNLQDISGLFGSEALSFFNQGHVATLLHNRNRHLGSLFMSERAVPYLNILYRMLLFKRDYELEPLYEDIYTASLSAQSAHDEAYDHDQFRSDLDRLAKWDLVSFRIEKQRLRGYRDNRKRKFRYRLTNETILFLEWLEQRLLDDIHQRGNDTRDLLGEMRGSLGELLRLLHHVKPDLENLEDTARRVLFQLFRAGDLCQEITTGLADFNIRLLFFLVKRYEIDHVRLLVNEIDLYVENFLKQTYSLRLEILPLLERLKNKNNLAKLSLCHEEMEKERLRAPNLLQTRRDAQAVTIPDRLFAFFDEQGGLDRLLHRINTSSLRVWQKLRSHLRELERKNNRLQDIGYRIEELASLPENETAPTFLNNLLAQPLCAFDPNYWDTLEKADPPKPKKRLKGKSGFPRHYLQGKQQTDKPVQSMDEARLALLKEWIEAKVANTTGNTYLLSEGNFDSFEDFIRIIELARAGLLADGKRLNRIEYSLSPGEREILLAISEQSLRFPEMTITPGKPG